MFGEKALRLTRSMILLVIVDYLLCEMRGNRPANFLTDFVSAQGACLLEAEGNYQCEKRKHGPD